MFALVFFMISQEKNFAGTTVSGGHNRPGTFARQVPQVEVSAASKLYCEQLQEARQLVSSGRYVDAIKNLEPMLQDPGADQRQMLAYCYIRTANWQLASIVLGEMWEQERQLNPDKKVIHTVGLQLKYSLALYMSGEKERANDEFDLSIFSAGEKKQFGLDESHLSLKSMDLGTDICLANAQYNSSDRGFARQCYKLALAMEPDHPRANVEYADLIARLSPKEAGRHYERALDAKDSDLRERARKGLEEIRAK